MTEEKTEIREVNLQQIKPSELQPRKHFPATGMDEMVQSVRAHGVVQPLIVRAANELRIEHEEDSAHFFIKKRRTPNAQRPTPNEDPPSREATADKGWQIIGAAESREKADELLAIHERFEIVCGERRWRAAETAGLKKVPVIVRVIDDLHVLRLQLVENLQRESLTPMEEAMGYKRLAEMGQSQVEIAESIGQSVAHVKHRLALCRLAGTQVADALERGEITPRHAEIISGVPSAALRVEILQKVMNPPDGSAAPWHSELLREHIRFDYMIDLRHAQFDKEDPTLVRVEYEKAATTDYTDDTDGGEDKESRRLWGGACGDCPFNVVPDGANPKARVRLCTNPECYRMKEIAAYERWRRVKEAAPPTRLAGCEILTLSHGENAALWGDSGTRLHSHSQYVELDGLPLETELRADSVKEPGSHGASIWRKLIEGQNAQIVLGRDAAGVEHELVKHDLAKKAAHANGHLIFRDSERERSLDREHSADPNAALPPAIGKRPTPNAQRPTPKAETEVKRAQVAAIVAAAESNGVRGGHVNLPMDFWAYAIVTLFDVLDSENRLDGILTTREWDSASASKEVQEMSLRGRMGLLAECLVELSDVGPAVCAKALGVRLPKN